VVRYESGTSKCVSYDETGQPYQRWDGMGRSVRSAVSSSVNWSLPTQIRPGDSSFLATSIAYNSAFQVTSLTGPEGNSTSVAYDAAGRPASARGPKPNPYQEGVLTTYTYPASNIQVAALNGRWKRTTYDGFARPVKVEAGYGGTTVSTVDTEYGPCACNPLGKMARQSAP
jgi:YD repeat-containing protein